MASFNHSLSRVVVFWLLKNFGRCSSNQIHACISFSFGSLFKGLLQLGGLQQTMKYQALPGGPWHLIPIAVRSGCSSGQSSYVILQRYGVRAPGNGLTVTKKGHQKIQVQIAVFFVRGAARIRRIAKSGKMKLEIRRFWGFSIRFSFRSICFRGHLNAFQNDILCWKNLIRGDHGGYFLLSSLEDDGRAVRRDRKS